MAVQTVADPAELKTGDVIYPYEKGEVERETLL